MRDFETAMINALEKNIQRYTRLLRTKLTAIERQYVQRRLSEDRQELRRLRGRQSFPQMTALTDRPVDAHVM